MLCRGGLWLCYAAVVVVLCRGWLCLCDAPCAFRCYDIVMSVSMRIVLLANLALSIVWSSVDSTSSIVVLLLCRVHRFVARALCLVRFFSVCVCVCVRVCIGSLSVFYDIISLFCVCCCVGFVCVDSVACSCLWCMTRVCAFPVYALRIVCHTRGPAPSAWLCTNLKLSANLPVVAEMADLRPEPGHLA